MYNPHLPCIARYVRYDSREARDLASNLIANPFHLLYTGVQAVICPECKAPMMVVDGHYHENLDTDKVDKILDGLD